MRRSVETAVVLAILAMALHYFVVLGVIVPIVITSGSMATGLLGPHRHVTCTTCGLPFDVGEETLPSNLLATCPNCGLSQNSLNESPKRAGNRLLVNRQAFLWRDPRRWEVVVFDCPEKPGELCVKRIVALPGENLQIRDGDLYLNGELLRKPLDVLRSLAVVVHDDHFRGQRQGERWRRTSDDWMVYEHVTPVYGNYSLPTLGPIQDDVSYNQNESRPLVPVHDLMLRCTGMAANIKPLRFRIASGGTVYQVDLDTEAGSGALLQDGDRIAEFSLPDHALQNESLVEFAVADQQAIFAINGQLLLSEVLSKKPVADAVDTSPIGHTVNFASSHSVVLRDVYYTSGFGQLPTLSSPPTYHLEPGEYFVLGDNSPLSEDSRTWPSRGVPAKSMVGTVLGAW